MFRVMVPELVIIINQPTFGLHVVVGTNTVTAKMVKIDDRSFNLEGFGSSTNLKLFPLLIMISGVRRLVIVEAGSKRVEGIISLSDVFRFLLGFG